MWDAITSMQVHGQQPPRPIDSYTKLLLHFGGADESTTFTDSGNTGHTVTANGDAQIDTTYKKFGTGAGLFDGTGDYLSVADHADWFMGTDEFTIDFWVRFETTPTTHIFCRTGSDPLFQFVFFSGGLQAYIYDGGIDLDFRATWVPVVGNWYHVALIRGWSGNVNDWAMTVDGVAIGTTTDAASVLDVAEVFTIGAASTGASCLDGSIDEFRVSKGIARWTSNFNPPIRAY